MMICHLLSKKRTFHVLHVNSCQCAGPCDNRVMESACYHKHCRGRSCKSIHPHQGLSSQFASLNNANNKGSQNWLQPLLDRVPCQGWGQRGGSDGLCPVCVYPISTAFPIPNAVF